MKKKIKNAVAAVKKAVATAIKPKRKARQKIVKNTKPAPPLSAEQWPKEKSRSRESRQ